jgi:hypothetical protein
MHRLLRAVVLGVPFALATSTGCGVEILDDQNGGQVPFAVEAAFERSCLGAGCHSSAQPAAGLSLEGAALQALVGASSSQRPELPLVAIGDVAGSYLAIKVLSDDGLASYGVSRAAGTSRMPLSGLSEQALEDVALILGWIAGAELPTPSDDGGAPTGESFDADIFPILQMRCGCHQLSGGAGGLEYDNATAYDSLVDQPASIAGLTYVVPSDPDASYLLAKVEGTHLMMGGDGDLMPPAPLAPLSVEDADLLRTWISLGAKP